MSVELQEKIHPTSYILTESLTRMGKFYLCSARPTDAKIYLERALSMPFPASLELLGSLADVYAAQGNYDKAELLYQKALKQCYPSASEDELIVRHNYAVLLRHQKRFAQASTMESTAKDRQTQLSQYKKNHHSQPGMTMHD